MQLEVAQKEAFRVKSEADAAGKALVAKVKVARRHWAKERATLRQSESMRAKQARGPRPRRPSLSRMATPDFARAGRRA